MHGATLMRGRLISVTASVEYVKYSALVITRVIPYCLSSWNRIIYNKTGNARKNVTLRFVLATVVAVEKQCVLHIPSVYL